MKVRFGVAPIAWTNSDLPQLGGDTTLETCLVESREAGFSGTETGVKFPMDPKVLGPILHKHDLKLVSGWFSGELLKRSLEDEKARMMSQMVLKSRGFAYVTSVVPMARGTQRLAVCPNTWK